MAQLVHMATDDVFFIFKPRKTVVSPWDTGLQVAYAVGVRRPETSDPGWLLAQLARWHAGHH